MYGGEQKTQTTKSSLPSPHGKAALLVLEAQKMAVIRWNQANIAFSQSRKGQELSRHPAIKLTKLQTNHAIPTRVPLYGYQAMRGWKGCSDGKWDDATSLWQKPRRGGLGKSSPKSAASSFWRKQTSTSTKKHPSSGLLDSHWLNVMCNLKPTRRKSKQPWSQPMYKTQRLHTHQNYWGMNSQDAKDYQECPDRYEKAASGIYQATAKVKYSKQ